MKYINTDLLKSKLKDVATEFKTGNYYLDNSEQAVGYENALIDFVQIIDSLQQEQPEVKLNEEIIINEFHAIRDKCFNEGIEGFQREKLIARHFYELGLKAKKEEK